MTAAAAGSSTPRPPKRIPAFVLLGAVVGVLAALAAAAGPSWTALLAHYGAGYVLLIALIGVLAPSPITAAVRSLACFVPFVVAYYAAVQIRFGAILMLYAAAWLAAALVVCPAAALIVRWSRDRSAPVGAVIAACAAAGVVADGTVRNAVLWLFGRVQGGSWTRYSRRSISSSWP